MTARRRVMPLAALSARQLDRMQKEIRDTLKWLHFHKFKRNGCALCEVRGLLARLLGMLERSERR